MYFLVFGQRCWTQGDFTFKLHSLNPSNSIEAMYVVFDVFGFSGSRGSFLNSALSKNTVPKGFGHATWTQAMGLVGWGWKAEISENVGNFFFVWRAVKNLHILHFFWGAGVRNTQSFGQLCVHPNFQPNLITRRSGEIWDDPLSGSSFVCDILTWSIS